jgi:hypothetical protein
VRILNDSSVCLHFPGFVKRPTCAPLWETGWQKASAAGRREALPASGKYRRFPGAGRRRAAATAGPLAAAIAEPIWRFHLAL